MGSGRGVRAAEGKRNGRATVGSSVLKAGEEHYPGGFARCDCFCCASYSPGRKNTSSFAKLIDNTG